MRAFLLRRAAWSVCPCQVKGLGPRVMLRRGLVPVKGRVLVVLRLQDAGLGQGLGAQPHTFLAMVMERTQGKLSRLVCGGSWA